MTMHLSARARLIGSTMAAWLLVAASAFAQDGARPWLGLSMAKDARGVVVDHVVRGSPADMAGIREGDHIERAGGVRVVRAADVIQAVSALSAGDRIKLDLTRAQGHPSIDVIVAPFPSQEQMVRMDLMGAPAPPLSGARAVTAAFPSSFAATRGHVVLLDFWATWCVPCRITIPKLQTLQERYGAQGLMVVGISTENPVDIAQFAQRMAIHYGVGADPEGAATRRYGIMSLPTLVVVDKAGNIRDVTVGYDGSLDGRLDSTIRALLDEPAPHS